MQTLVQTGEWECASRIADACGVTRYRLLGAAAAGLVKTQQHKGRTLFNRGDAVKLFGPADGKDFTAA